MVYVTHDQVEAMTLADKIVVLDGGRVQQVGAPMEIYKRPANAFVAGFIGSPRMNFLEVDVESVAGGAVTVRSPTVAPVAVAASGFSPGERALLGLRPQYLRPGADAPLPGRVEGRVSLVERLGTETVVSFETVSGERALAAIPQDLGFEPGSAVEFRFDPAAAHLFAAA